MKNSKKCRTVGKTIEITQRHCSDKIQKNISVGKRFLVTDTSQLSDGTLVIIVNHPGRKNATLRINAHRFTWRVVSDVQLKEECKISEAKKRIQKAKNLLETKFSEKEQRQILFVPGAILAMAMLYAHKAQDIGLGKIMGGEPMSDYKKLSRKLNEIFENLERDKRVALGSRGEYLDKTVNAFIDSASTKLAVFLNVIQVEYFRVTPKAPERITTLRMYAALSYYLVDILLDQEKFIDELITKKFGGCYPHVVSSNVEKLQDIMAGYSEINSIGFKKNQNISIGYNALKYAINEIPFNFKGE